MSTLIAGFATSFLLGFLILRFQHLHEHISADFNDGAVQRFHQSMVPRIGGIALIGGIFMAISTLYFKDLEIWGWAMTLLLSSLPVFLIGLLEDVTKKVSIRVRFAAAITSALLAGFLFDTWLVNVQFFGIDLLLKIPAFSIIFTCFAVGGVTNSFNIIDGYNGLVGMVACIIFAAIAYVAFQVHDFAVMVCALAAVGGALGFLVWNYPRGLIFLGDGGAYLLGFWAAELSVLLVTRNHSVSKWFPVLICIYPIVETVFTMYRRFIFKKRDVSLPDAIHLHQLIYRRVVKWSTKSDDILLLNQHNSLTSPYLWVLVALFVIPAVMCWENHWILQASCVIFILVYLWLYVRIIKFRVPKWLLLNRKD